MKKITMGVVVILYFLQWLFTILGNITEVIANGVTEIILTLENFMESNAKTKLTSPAASDEAE